MSTYQPKELPSIHILIFYQKWHLNPNFSPTEKLYKNFQKSKIKNATSQTPIQNTTFHQYTSFTKYLYLLRYGDISTSTHFFCTSKFELFFLRNQKFKFDKFLSHALSTTQNEVKEPKSIHIFTMKLLYTYFWKMLLWFGLHQFGSFEPKLRNPPQITWKVRLIHETVWYLFHLMCSSHWILMLLFLFVSLLHTLILFQFLDTLSFAHFHKYTWYTYFMLVFLVSFACSCMIYCHVNQSSKPNICLLSRNWTQFLCVQLLIYNCCINASSLVLD